MPNVRYDREPDSGRVKVLRGSAPSYSAAILQTGMFSDYDLSTPRTVRKILTNSIRKSPNIFLVNLLSFLCLTQSPPFTNIRILKALFFSLLERIFFDQKPLALIAVPRPTPLEYHG
jgi:hypothetical protein